MERRGEVAAERITVRLVGLAVELLGGVRAVSNGVPTGLGGRRPSTVLASLVLADRRVVSADRLVELVWDDEQPRSARRTLQSYVSGLRRRLGDDGGRLSASGAGYVLSIERADVDLFAFADTIASAESQIMHDPTGAVTRLSSALTSWAEPLDGLRPSRALCAMVAPFEELRLEALEMLIDVELDHGQDARAVARLETLVREHPMRERFWGQLVRGLAALGRRDAALHASQRARESLREHLGVDPSILLQRLEREVLDGGSLAFLSGTERPPASAPAPQGNLVPAATELIGRAAELQLGTAELRTRRLLTLTGAGGVGKTRLAIELGRCVLEEFPGGVWLVELAPVPDPSAIATVVASSLGIPPAPDMTKVEAVVDWLQGRRLLLIIDNCEHLLGAVGDLVAAVVAGCPTVTVLATSREPLGVDGERVHLVPTLDPASEGVELFCVHAVAADASFRPGAEDLATIAAICERVDGLPLAIELAASRVRALAPADLLAHLDERFGLLHGRRSASDRHQTMHATVQWSYQLLDERERLLFDRLSVFAGGFDLAAVEAVCSDDEDVQRDTAVGVMASLVDKSLVVADRDRHGMRYRLLEPMREYGEARLQQRAATQSMRTRHLAHYVDVARRANELWSGPGQLQADAILDRDWDNLRIAHSWALENADLGTADELVAATGPHAWCRMRHEHGAWATENLAVQTVDHGAHPTTHGWAAEWAFVELDHGGALERARQGIAAAPSPEHPDTAWCWAVLVNAELAWGDVAQAQEDVVLARVASADNREPFVQWWILAAAVDIAFETDLAAVPMWLDELVALSDTVGAPSLQARTELYKGRGRMWVEHPPDGQGALECYRRGLDLARNAADVHNANLNLAGIVYASTNLQLPDATEACKEAITCLYAARQWSALWLALGAIASWWTTLGRLEEVAVICGHSEVHPGPWVDIDGSIRQHPDLRRDPRLKQLMADGGAMDRDDLVRFVLDRLAHVADDQHIRCHKVNDRLDSAGR